MKIIEKNFFQFFIFYNFFTSVVVGRLTVLVDVKAAYCCRVHFCSFLWFFFWGLDSRSSREWRRGQARNDEGVKPENPFPDTCRGVLIDLKENAQPKSYLRLGNSP